MKDVNQCLWMCSKDNTSFDMPSLRNTHCKKDQSPLKIRKGHFLSVFFNERYLLFDEERGSREGIFFMLFLVLCVSPRPVSHGFYRVMSVKFLLPDNQSDYFLLL